MSMVDTFAVLAILFQEENATRFARAIESSKLPCSPRPLRRGIGVQY